MKSCFLLMSLSVLLLLPGMSARAGDTVFAVTPTDVEYLKYYKVVNTFDSCSIMYSLGELRLRTSGVYSRLFLDTLLPADSAVASTSTPGPLDDLCVILRSRTFYIAPTTDSLSLYREISLRPGIHVLERRTSAWRVNDRTEYVLQLVRESDGVVIAVLDSVGMDSAALGTSYPEYGTTPGSWCKVVYIPPGIRSCSAFVRVSPRRYGSSLFGIVAVNVRKSYSESVRYSCSPNIMPPLSFYDDMRNTLFSRLISFYDRYYAANCALPALATSLLDPTQVDSITRRYYEPWFYDSLGGRQVYRLIPCSGLKAPVPYTLTRAWKNLELTAMNYTGSELKIFVKARKSTNAEILVYDSRGANVQQFVQRNYAAGTSTESLGLSLKRGAYFVALRGLSPESWSYQKLLVP